MDRREKLKEKDKCFDFLYLTVISFSGYIRESVLTCLSAVENISRANSFVEVENIIHRIPK